MTYYQALAAKATGLRERIDHFERFRFIQPAEADFSRRLADWKQAAAAGEEDLFKNRLANDGISPEMMRSVLGEVVAGTPDDPPQWLTFFMGLTGFLEDYNPDRLNGDMDRLFGAGHSTTIAYLDLVTPVVAYASALLDERAGKEMERLISPEAACEMHLQLARMLVFLSSQTFHLEFQVFRGMRQSALWRLMDAAGAGDRPGNSLYREFTVNFVRSAYRRFFEEYAALARILSIVTRNWIQNTSDFLQRLAEDRGAISERFFPGADPGRVSGYKGGISDSHDQGKSVVSLKFESGAKLIYKPKNLELEQAWTDFLNWFNDHGLKPALKPLDVLHRGHYGWVGFIEPMPCETAAGVADFYRRTGSLVALIYLLNGNDCHHENLIASGDHPVIIDLESVMHHEGRSFVEESPDSAVFLANSQFGTSVFRTGILPAWITAKDGYVFDISGIGGYGHSESPYRQIRWENTNTDRMEFSLAPVKLQELTNLPVFAGQKHLPVAYQEEIIEGFTRVYRMLLQYRSDVPLHLFEGKELRFIFRATRIYGLIMKKLMNPKYMRSGLERSIQMEMLCRAFIHTSPPNPFWNICTSELRQMEEADFPIFRAGSDSADLRDSSGVIVKDYLNGAVFGQVSNTLTNLCEEDLERQVKFIRASLFFRDVDHGNKAAGETTGFARTVYSSNEATGETVASVNTVNEIAVHRNEAGRSYLFPGKDLATEGGIKPATINGSGAVKVEEAVRQRFLDTAMSIAGTLRDEAIFSSDGSCAWIAVGIIPGTDKYRMQPTSMYLYDGLAGIAVFLSALYRITGDRNVGQLNDATLQSIFRVTDLYHKFTGLAPVGSVGATSGFSSMVYALSVIAGILEDPSYLQKAKEVSQLITPGMIRNDRNYDVMTGTAGCLLAMLRLHQATGDASLLEKADICGNHLLNSATFRDDGSCGWQTMRGKMLTGFSHGAAGIAFALFSAFEITGCRRYYETAAQAIRYENQHFSPHHQNWQDLRDLPGHAEGEPQFMTSWCHGAPGIALGRLGARHIYNNETVQADITAALGTTAGTGMMNADHLCCGNLGRAEVLNYAALKEKDQTLLDQAYARIRESLDRATANGHFILFHQHGEPFFNPGFFQGLSGIGYQLLRMAYPGNFPAILTLE